MIGINDLEMALDFNSSDPFSESDIYLDTESGQLYYISDFIDEKPPADIYENKKYLQLPTKQDLDLGKPLALGFAQEHLSEQFDKVYSMFRLNGAYSRFKALLDIKGALALWRFGTTMNKLKLDRLLSLGAKTMIFSYQMTCNTFFRQLR